MPASRSTNAPISWPARPSARASRPAGARWGAPSRSMVMARTADLIARDRAAVWHPYAPPALTVPPFPVARTEGVHIVLEDGRVLVDGMSSWWAAIHGYNHPALVSAMEQQLHRMSHVMFGGLTHAPAI